MSNENARRLRKTMTDAEKRLWSALRDKRLGSFKFRRQRPVGPFIADFACIEKRLIIEADGGQHNENAEDARRTAWLENHGWIVLRFWNNDILKNTEGVLTRILEVVSGLDSRRRRQGTLR
jgi:primosomal protein N' (replication factor Y)